MTKLTLSDIKNCVAEKNISFEPVNCKFYKKYSYKIEFKNKHQDIKFTSRRRHLYLDLDDLKSCKSSLASFNKDIDKAIENREYSTKLKNNLAQFSQIRYNWGFSRNIIYIENPETVLEILEKFCHDIKTVSIFIDESELGKNNNNIVLRKSLFYQKYRFCLEFKLDFEDALKIKDYLMTLDKNSWTERRLSIILKYHEFHSRFNVQNQYYAPNDICRVFLENKEDYIYLKILAGECVKSSTEIVLNSELTD